MNECRDRVAADLRRYYGISLVRAEAGGEDPFEIAELVKNLPRGSEVRKWFGGREAISEVEEELQRVQHLLDAQMYQTAGKKKPPPTPEYPKGIRDAKQRVDKARSNRNRVLDAVKQGWR